MSFKTYEKKIFLVEDNETRIRKADDLSQSAIFTTADLLPEGQQVGNFKILPKRTPVHVTAVKVNADRTVFAQVTPAEPGSRLPAGWTKASNLLGGMLNELAGLAPANWVLPPAGKNFTVIDDRALVRAGAPDFTSRGQTLPRGTFVLAIAESGTTDPRGKYVKICEGRLEHDEPQAGAALGWTAASNLIEGWSSDFTTAAWMSERSLNACWEKGKFIGNRILVNIIGTGGEMEQVTLAGLRAYRRLLGAAARKNLALSINSGFRTFQRQQELYTAFQHGQGNKAARPGASNHQNGRAFDLNTHGFDGDPVYDWLRKNGPRYGFLRTVSGEHWHWEYRPAEAANLAPQGKFKLAGVAK